MLVKDLARDKNRIKSFLYFHGIEIPGTFSNSQTHWSKRFMNWLESINLSEESSKLSLSILLSESYNLRLALLEAIRISRFVDYILLDSGNPNPKVKELGGTGRVHNWGISKKIRKMVEVPVYLAGGLNPHNVKKAIETVQPFGVDLCSGVRTNNNLDENKLKQFFESIKKN